MSERGNALSFARLITFIALLMIFGFGAVYVQQYGVWMAIPFFYAYYFVFGFRGALAHELQHQIVFTKRLNGFSEILFYFVQTLICLSQTYSTTYKTHHRYTMVRGKDYETRDHENISGTWAKNT